MKFTKLHYSHLSKWDRLRGIKPTFTARRGKCIQNCARPYEEINASNKAFYVCIFFRPIDIYPHMHIFFKYYMIRQFSSRTLWWTRLVNNIVETIVRQLELPPFFAYSRQKCSVDNWSTTAHLVDFAYAPLTRTEQTGYQRNILCDCTQKTVKLLAAWQ